MLTSPLHDRLVPRRNEFYRVGMTSIFWCGGGDLAFWRCNLFCNYLSSEPSHSVQHYAKPTGGVSSSNSSESSCLRGD